MPLTESLGPQKHSVYDRGRESQKYTLYSRFIQRQAPVQSGSEGAFAYIFYQVYAPRSRINGKRKPFAKTKQLF